VYGTTLGGGYPGYTGRGTVFQLAPTPAGYVETVLHRFRGGDDGAWPYAGLLLEQDHAQVHLYGTTDAGGGAAGCPAGPSCGMAFDVLP
jgi:hypothetical protein